MIDAIEVPRLMYSMYRRGITPLTEGELKLGSSRWPQQCGSGGRVCNTCTTAIVTEELDNALPPPTPQKRYRDINREI